MASTPTPTPAPSSEVIATPAPTGEEQVEEKDIKLTSADYYFDSYAHFGIHEEMLKDEVRTTTYMNAIVSNKHLFEGKTVLDVGCGTGILCMFAAKAGAAKVIGVECAGIIESARKIVDLNGFSDVITLVHGKIEEVELPVEKVDIIISEWMGYFLIYESMLDSVIFARDKWLADGGMLFPDRAQLKILAIEDSEYRAEKIDFWDNVYGFDMSPIKSLALLEPLVEACDAEQIISAPETILDIDLATVTKEELDFKSEFDIKVRRTDLCHALVSYFDVQFTKSHKKYEIKTGPRDITTHWKQTVFYFEEPLKPVAADVIHGSISVKRNAGNARDLDIVLDVALRGQNAAKTKQFYRLR